MTLSFAFIGFRHGHILDLYRRASAHPEIDLVATCEEDRATRASLASSGVVITHIDIDALCAEHRDQPVADVIAIGDAYGRRGCIAIQALTHGAHVLADKPVCTRMEELDEIERLATSKGLQVGCMLTMRDMPQIIGARDLIRDGAIGEVQAITFGGQHPLNRGTRPSWYFEPGMHGGTINDIAIHAFDCIPWITGARFETICCARCWNAHVRDVPHFQDGAQFMLTMDNGCGVQGDVSYFLPAPAGYTLPYYWRMTFFGAKGILETSATASEITLALTGAPGTETRPLPEGDEGGYLESFLASLRGETPPDGLDTRAVLDASRLALAVQRAADQHLYDVAL